MTNLLLSLYNDQRGFIVSGELVLIATIAVLALVVGLSEVATNINHELEDVGSAFAALNQGYSSQGACGHGGNKQGSCFQDKSDFCDQQGDIKSTCPTPESGCSY